MSVQSKGVLSSSQQLNYLFTWFNEFSELQKSDFLDTILTNYSAQQCNTNGLQHNNNAIEEDNNRVGSQLDVTSARPMSIFQCRMKLFNEWFCLWNETEKQEFLTRVHNSDQLFHQLFITKLNQNKQVVAPQEQEREEVDQNVDQQQQQEQPLVIEEEAEQALVEQVVDVKEDNGIGVDEEVVDVVNASKLDNGNNDDVEEVVEEVNGVIITDENNSLLINE